MPISQCICILQERSKVQDEIRESARKKSNFTKQLEILAELENALPKVELCTMQFILIQPTLRPLLFLAFEGKRHLSLF